MGPQEQTKDIYIYIYIIGAGNHIHSYVISS